MRKRAKIMSNLAVNSVPAYGSNLWPEWWHYNDIIMSVMVSQITGLTIACATVYSGVDQRKHQSSALLAFVRGIDRWPVNTLHKGPVPQKIIPFDDVIMTKFTLKCDRKIMYWNGKDWIIQYDMITFLPTPKNTDRWLQALIAYQYNQLIAFLCVGKWQPNIHYIYNTFFSACGVWGVCGGVWGVLNYSWPTSSYAWGNWAKFDLNNIAEWLVKWTLGHYLKQCWCII